MDARESLHVSQVPDDAIVWRRVPPWHIEPNGVRPKKADGTFRPSSAAFEDDGDGDPMSVDIVDDSLTIQRELAGHEGYGVVSISVGELRKLDLDVRRKIEPNNPNHGQVIGHKTRSIRNKIAEKCVWVFDPLIDRSLNATT